MEVQSIADQLVRLCREGKNQEAKDLFYADDIVSIEGNGESSKGIKALAVKSQAFYNSIVSFNGITISNPIVAKDHFAVQISMDLTAQNGYNLVMNEIAVYTVKDSKIVTEQFFYNS